MPAVRTLTALLDARTAAIPVALCRIGLGIAAFGRNLKSARDLYLLQHDPSVVPARIFDWAPRVATMPEIVLVAGISLAASVTLTIGYRARLSSAILVCSLVFLYLVDQSFWANHAYFLALMLMLLSLTESDAALSVRSRRLTSATTVIAWPVLLMKIQLSLVYFYTAAAKLNPVFLSGHTMATRSIVPDLPTSLMVGLSWLAVGSELFLSFALWLRRLRFWGLLVGVGLHGLVPILFGPYAGLVVFTVATLGVYALFLDQADLAALRNRLAARVPALMNTTGAARPDREEARSVRDRLTS